MDASTKLEIAHGLADAGVDIIEAGFPCSSPADLEIVRRIGQEVRGPIICGLARIKKEDIDACVQALEGAPRARIHVFASTSEVHIRKKLRVAPGFVLDQTGEMVRYARQFVDDVQFSAEDATRTNWEYLSDVITIAIQAGATTINLPDTVGYSHPLAMQTMLEYLYRHIPGMRAVTVSMHCHNDLGMAVANSFAGVLNGARQVEGCFLGIGERAGNADLGAIIMAIHSHGRSINLRTNIQTEKLGPLSRMISSRIGYPIPAHYPIVGDLAFAHSSGIHRDGMDKDRRTYEIMDPETIGWQGVSVELTARMGRNGLRNILNELGYDGVNLIDRVYPAFLVLADLKLRLNTDDLHMIVQEILIQEEAIRGNLFTLADLDYRPRWGSVEIRRNGNIEKAESSGNGAIDALYEAIREAISTHGCDLSDLTLDDYSVIKGQGGPEAIGWVVVRVSQGGRKGFGRSGDTDVNKASAQALVYAINHLLQAPVRTVPEQTP